MTRRELERKVEDLAVSNEELTGRVEGLESLLADLITDGRIVVELPPAPFDARAVESGIERPSPAWGREP